jgi:hypothetical protein
MKRMTVVIDDGGRAKAGFKSARGDCVARAIAIVTGRPYREVYDRLAEGNATQRAGKRTGRKARTASDGINVKRKWCQDYMRELGFVWVPIMGIGTGCTVHLARGELPNGRLIASVSKHWTAVIDGVIFDVYDPSRGGTRCVYGYYRFEGVPSR